MPDAGVPPPGGADDFEEAIRATVRERVSPARYQHILAVADLAGLLARHWGIGEGRARRAALLHDYARDMTEHELLRTAEAFGLTVSPFDRQHPGLLHGRIAAHIAQRDFRLDPVAGAAIAGHTTGRVGMGTFELLLFVADHAAEGRRGEGPPRWRELARTDLVAAAREIMDDLIKRSLKRGYAIAPQLAEARNDLLRRQGDAVVYSTEAPASVDLPQD